MLGVIGALDQFHRRSTQIFDRIEEHCGSVEERLNSLEDRLERSVSTIENARGSTQQLTVQSGRQLRRWKGQHCTERTLDEDTLTALGIAASLPEETALGSAPSLTTAAADLARVCRGVTALDTGVRRKGRERENPEKLLEGQGRLTSVAELFLFNTKSNAYAGHRLEVDNFAVPPESEDEDVDRITSLRPERIAPSFRLDEDEVDPRQEDLRFVPRAADRVTFQLPDVLNLGGVVAGGWNDEDAAEDTTKAVWDDVPALRRGSDAASAVSGKSKKSRKSMVSDRRSVVLGTDVGAKSASEQAASTSGIARAPSLFRPPGRANLAASDDASRPAAAIPPPSSTAPPEVPKRSPPPPAKVKGKGKGKGSPPPPPPPAGKGGGKGPPPPPKKPPPPPGKAKAGGEGKAAMFAAIQKGAALKKAPPPKERTGAPVGRVL